MDQRKTMHDILTQREDFLVIGLTGRLGSGCSKVAEVLATPFDEMNFPNPVPQLGLPSLTEESRTIRILAEYAQAHWLKFDVIQVGAIIATFILNDDSRFIYDLNRGVAERKHDELRISFREKVFEDFYCNVFQLGQVLGVIGLEEEKENYLRRITTHKETEKVGKDYLPVNSIGTLLVRNLLTEEYEKALHKKLTQLIDNINNLVSDELLGSAKVSLEEVLNTPSAKSKSDWKKIGIQMDRLYREVLQKDPTIHRRKYLECVDGILTLISFHCLVIQLNDFLGKKIAVDELWMWLKCVNDCVAPNAKEDPNVLQIHQFVFVRYLTSWFGKTVRDTARHSLGDDAYTRLFQRYGQMIRFHGHIPPHEGENTFSGKRDIFAIPRKINQHIKVLRHPFDKKSHRPVRIVVDSIKNVFEAVYLRYRYSAFYLWAITTDSDIRERRLHEKHLTDMQIRQLEWNEYPDKGSEIIKKVAKAMERYEFDPKDASQWQKNRNVLSRDGIIREEEVDFFFDRLPNIQSDKSNSDVDEFDEIRQRFFQSGTYVFYAQDVDSCVCNADVYLFNNVSGFGDAENQFKLLEAVVRNVSLAMYPGLVRPTSVERCMQIALSAKVNSGCLSRQVGAVVTDSQYNILAIGWNDVPCGEVPCAYKNLHDVVAGADPDAYSEYELTNQDFRDRIKKYNAERSVLGGLPCSYCFKDVHKDGKDPMRSRAMHAEEKALALCGREAEGGFLFTTSSPCEMCSKNAKNHKIRKIFYIEAYPGISQAQYTNSGDKNNRAELILFSGAVGRAYMQMYTPLLPHKDVLNYLDIRERQD